MIFLPAPEIKLPTSECSTKGPTCGLTPPSRSSSASINDDLSSVRVEPPTIANIKHPSDFITLYTGKNSKKIIMMLAIFPIQINMRNKYWNNNNHEIYIFKKKMNFYSSHLNF